MSDIPDSIVRELRFASSIDDVWPFLGTAEGFSRWFCDRVEGEWVAGETVTLVIGEIRARMRIESLEAPQRLVTRGMPGREQDGVFGEETRTVVTYALSPDGDGTKLVLTESGFAKLRRADYDGNNEGWDIQVPKLQAVVA